MNPGTLASLKKADPAKAEAQARVDRTALALAVPTFELLAREGSLTPDGFAESVWRFAQALEKARPT